MDANPELQPGARITLKDAWRLMLLTLWDEDTRQLVRFRDVRRARPRVEKRKAA
jgi:hypothetical protein